VRTAPQKTTFTKKHGTRHWKVRILKNRGTNRVTGHRVSLWKNGKNKDWLTARIVAMTFLGIPESKLTVNHKDGDRFNNNIENLEWLTIADNIRHGFETGLYPQIEITLASSSGMEFVFRSKSVACRFLGRNHSYVYSAIKFNRTITNINPI
jgi:hypothetical protein